jgi:SAM-dependent methyltransferase
LKQIFEPGMVTTERVIEYPFVFQHLNGVVGPVLDLGCCHSRLPLALASRGFEVVGMDFNPYPYRHPGLRALRGDIMKIPFAAGTFSAVLAVSVIEHIGIGHYGEPEADIGDRVAVREIARILKPGGKALITVPYGRTHTNDWMRVYDQPRLAQLTAALATDQVEYAVSRTGLWMPAEEGEAATIGGTGLLVPWRSWWLPKRPKELTYAIAFSGTGASVRPSWGRGVTHAASCAVSREALRGRSDRSGA